MIVDIGLQINQINVIHRRDANYFLASFFMNSNYNKVNFFKNFTIPLVDFVYLYCYNLGEYKFLDAFLKIYCEFRGIIMIIFDDVCKTYSTGIEAVKHTTLEIEKGEFAFIVGPSGCGKSTLMKMLLKEVEPTSGSIYVNGKDITKITKDKVPLLRRKMGIVFQDFRLLPDRTIYENVAYAMRVIGARPSAIKRQVPTVLSLVGLLNKSKMYPDELSGGEQQRVAVARAIVNNPMMLIADEPTGNLDPDTAWEIMSLLNDINRRGTTVVVATHAKDIVDKMQKRVIAIENGTVWSDIKKGVYSNEHKYD